MIGRINKKEKKNFFFAIFSVTIKEFLCALCRRQFFISYTDGDVEQSNKLGKTMLMSLDLKG